MLSGLNILIKMSSTNQSPAYQKAHGKFIMAKNDEERINALEEMIRECPKHKSSENMLANLKTRHKKLKEKIERVKKTKKGASKKGIKKEEMQAVIVGFTNTGRSSLISLLTNADAQVSKYPFMTIFPVIGMMPYSGTKIQIIEVPAFNSENYDKGLVNSADVVLLMIDNLSQIQQSQEILQNAAGKKIIIFNKIDLMDEGEKRKIESTLKSKKYDFIMISAETRQSIEELKNKIFSSFGKIRVFTKEPGKPKSENPLILSPESIVKDVAEKILKGLSKRIKETKIWGPSSKFPGQKVGLAHILKDMDIVEFKTE